MPSNIIGIGIIKGTNETNTPTTSSSARMLPNRRKLSETGLVPKLTLNKSKKLPLS